MTTVEGYIRTRVVQIEDGEKVKTVKCFFSDAGEDAKPFGVDDVPVDVFLAKLKAYLEGEL